MSEVIIPLGPKGLDLLEWFGQWRPKVYREDWDRLKTKPPGFRTLHDFTVYHANRKLLPDFEIPPHKKEAWGIAKNLHAYGLLEGYLQFYRLTQKGRAALKLHGRNVPNFFTSHCPEIFDNFDLTPHVLPGEDLYDLGSHNEKLPDNEGTWRKMLRLYGNPRHTSKVGMTTDASAIVTRPSGVFYLNGSLRKHHRAIEVTVRNRAGKQVCSFMCSSEQFTDLLTSNSMTPVTLTGYLGSDGVYRSEPVPPPVNIGKRMEHRVENLNLETLQRLDRAIETVQGLKMGKRAKEALVKDLKNIRELWPANTSFAVTQAVEEVSSIVEGVLTMVGERQDMALQDPQTFAKSFLLPAGEEDPDALDME